MSRRNLSLVAGVALLFAAWGLTELPRPPSTRTFRNDTARAAREERIVSLSPGITETLESLDAGHLLVGVSDYCAPRSGQDLLRAGSALSPNYEVLARLSPSLVLASEVQGEQLVPLQKLAPTVSLPWLTLDEWTHSITKLGALVHRTKEAASLRSRIENSLNVTPPADGPRVLFALDYGDTGSNEVWFIRKNSIHGALLHASGARNAVAREILGQPKLSPEELLSVDPDAIVVLVADAQGVSLVDVRNRFARMSPLRAVKTGRIEILAAKGSLTIGPSILGLLPRLRAIVQSFEGGTP